MKYDAPTISRLAQDAGFVRPAIHVATAIALAGSNGYAHYNHVCGIPGAGRYVGLWAIDADEWTDYEPAWLMDAENAAQAAYELTQRCAGFGWSAVWRRGTEHAHLSQAATASTMQPHQQTEDRPIHVLTARRQLDAMAARLRSKQRNG